MSRSSREARRIRRAFLRQMGATPERRHLITAGRVFVTLAVLYGVVALAMILTLHP